MFQISRIFPDARFNLIRPSESGCDIHLCACPPVGVQFPVNELKQIARIGIALFFETGIELNIGGVLPDEPYCCRLVRASVNGNIGTDGVGRRANVPDGGFSRGDMIGLGQCQGQRRFLSERQSRSQHQEKHKQAIEIFCSGYEERRAESFGFWHARYPASCIPTKSVRGRTFGTSFRPFCCPKFFMSQKSTVPVTHKPVNVSVYVSPCQRAECRV